MRSRVPLLAALVPSIRSAYLPSRTGSWTILTASDLGAPFHCSRFPVSKSPRQITSAGAVATSRPTRIIDRMVVLRPYPPYSAFYAELPTRNDPPREQALVKALALLLVLMPCAAQEPPKPGG